MQNLEQISIYLTISDFCNLHCKYCNQQKKYLNFDDIDFENIKKLPLEFFKQHYNQITFCKIKKIHFYLKGGQLFYTQFFKSLQPYLLTLFSQINRLFKWQEKDYNIITNGLFTNYDYIKKFLNKTKSRLIITYDPNRFITQFAKQTYFKTLQYFAKENYLNYLSIILYKQSAEYYMQNINQIRDICISNNINAKLQIYKSNKNQYNIDQVLFKKFINKAKRNSWKKFCQNISSIQLNNQPENIFKINLNGQIQK